MGFRVYFIGFRVYFRVYNIVSGIWCFRDERLDTFLAALLFLAAFSFRAVSTNCSFITSVTKLESSQKMWMNGMVEVFSKQSLYCLRCRV